MSDKHPVADALRKLGKLYDERAAVYGDNYKHFGKVMKGIFPHGLELKTEDDFNRFGVFVIAAVKMTRYGQMFNRGGHLDSLDDSSVYLQMLAELDRDIAGSNPPF